MKKQLSQRAKPETLEPMILLSASAIEGTDGDDVLFSLVNGQEVDGGDGNDFILGVGGDNVLKGGNGDDRFITVLGQNVVIGGDGADTLQFLNEDAGDFNIIDRGNGIVEFSNARQTTYVTQVEAVQFLDQLFLIDTLLEGRNTNTPPVIFTPDSPNISVQENQTAVINVNAEDADGDDLTYAIAEQGDGDLFEIDSQTGQLTFRNAPDFEAPLDENGDNSYDVTVVVSDGESTVEKQLRVQVADLAETNNNPPTFTNISESQIILVTEGNSQVIDIDAEDPDGDSITYLTVDGIGIPGSGVNEDPGAFTLDARTGELRFKSIPDFSNPADADGDNEYHIAVAAIDGNGGAVEKNLVIQVQPNGSIETAPIFTNVEEGEIVTVPENTTLVGDADGTDPDGDSVTFSIVGGDDAAAFFIDPDTGVVSFIEAPDFEQPTDQNGDNDYQVQLRISDGQLSQERNVVVRVTDQIDGQNNAPYFTNVEEGEIVTVPENTKFVGDADGNDPDSDSVIYSIQGGADASLFKVNPYSGVVSFIDTPDFERPRDADGDNEYELKLGISDGDLSQTRNVVVKVTDRNESGASENKPPFFTNVHQGEVVWVREHTTYVGDADASDRNGDQLTYSISGGADASHFEIDAYTGRVSFISPPDFEYPTDADGDNHYELTLRVSDGYNYQEKSVSIVVKDVRRKHTC